MLLSWIYKNIENKQTCDDDDDDNDNDKWHIHTVESIE